MDKTDFDNEYFDKPIKPDVIIDYISVASDLPTDLPTALVYVRPETNEVHYEKAIILGITPYADVVYLANLNGRIFIKDALILDHYASQYRFAVYAKEEMARFPEFVETFENYFKTSFDSSFIIGSFDALIKLNLNDESLFNYIVEDKDFLKLYGQTIKKINNVFVVNYDMPAIIKRYTPKANVFAIAIKFKDKNTSFLEINQSIFDQIKKNNMVIVDEEFHKSLEWNERIRRTYHISRNNVMAMFDMVDFIIRNNNDHLRFIETPLGKTLIEENGISEDFIIRIKEFPIVYIEENGKKRLVNLLEEANGMNMEECVNLIKRIRIV